MPGVSATGSVDRRLTEMAEGAGVLPKGVSPHGKTAAETKEAQKPHLLHKMRKTGVKVAAEGLSMALEGASGVSAGVAAALLGPAFTTYKLLESFFKAHAEGEELRDGYARDAVNLAFICAAKSALPRDYVAKMSVELHAAGGEGGGASKLLSRLSKNAVEWEQFQKQAADHVRVGRDTATRLNVTSKTALEGRLKTDRQFAALYQQNLGFKHGVDSVIYDNVQRQIYGKVSAP